MVTHNHLLLLLCTEPDIIQDLHFAEDIFADIQMFVV